MQVIVVGDPKDKSGEGYVILDCVEKTRLTVFDNLRNGTGSRRDNRNSVNKCLEWHQPERLIP